jgi:hypothetical protein
LAALREQLERAGALAHDLDEAGFVSAIRATVADSTDQVTAAAYEQALPPAQSFHGLVRYCRASTAEGSQL